MKISKPIDNATVTASEERRAVQHDGTPANESLHWFAAGSGWNIDGLKQALRQGAADNNIDEALIRADDGKIYVVFADDLPKLFVPGERFASEEATGTIVYVQRELDIDQILTRTVGHGAAAVLDVLTAAAVLATPISGGGSLFIAAPAGAAAAALHYLTEAIVERLPRDSRQLEKLVGQPRKKITPTDNALAPKKP